MTFDYSVIMLDMPAKIHAFTVMNDDGSYTIFINDCLTPMAKRAAFRHELNHIERSDFFREDVQELEALAHLDRVI